MTGGDLMALDQRLRRLEAQTARRGAAPATPDAIAEDSSLALTFLETPIVVDESTGEDDFRSWTAYAPNRETQARSVILAFEMGETGGTNGERRIDSSVDGGSSAFLVGRIDVIGSGADFGVGSTVGPLPCRSDGSFDYRVTGPSLKYWKLSVVGWLG